MLKENEALQIREYLKVIQKWWVLLVIIILLCCLIGYVVARLMPHYAETSIIMDFGDTKIVPPKTIDKIREGFYNDKILSKLNQKDQDEKLRIGAFLLADLPVIRVSVKSLAQDSSREQEFLQQLYYELQEENKAAIELEREKERKKQEQGNKKLSVLKAIEERKRKIRTKIAEIDIQEKEGQINRLEAKMKKLDEQRGELLNKYAEAKKDYEEKKENNWKMSGRKDETITTALELILIDTYNDRQNTYLFFQGQLRELDNTEEEVIEKIQSKKSEIARQKMEKDFIGLDEQASNLATETMAQEESGLKEITLIQKPLSSFVKGQTKTIMAIFIALGVMAGLLVTFAMEYFESKGKSS